MQVFPLHFRKKSQIIQEKSISWPVSYAQYCFRMFSRAAALLVWQRHTGMDFFFASSTAQFTILWETVLVNRIIRSGTPIFFFIAHKKKKKTFALHPNPLQISSYWHIILSLPPTITTLIIHSPLISELFLYNCYWLSLTNSWFKILS